MIPQVNIDPGHVRRELALFSGGTGGIDNWLVGDHNQQVCERIGRLGSEALSCSQLNQLLALSHQAEVSPGFFKFYWTTAQPHPYDVTALPWYHDSYRTVDQVLTLDQLRWGLYRLYVDSLLYYGTIENGYRELRTKTFDFLSKTFQERRYAADKMTHRGRPLELGQISKDDRYLIAEQACKSFDPPDEEHTNLLMILRGGRRRVSDLSAPRTVSRFLRNNRVFSSKNKSPT